MKLGKKEVVPIAKICYNEDMIIKNEQKKYASDLTDSQWEMIVPLFPPAGNNGKSK